MRWTLPALMILFLAACEPAWDGPSFLAAADVMGGGTSGPPLVPAGSRDVFSYPGEDISLAPDLAVPRPDLPAPADVQEWPEDAGAIEDLADASVEPPPDTGGEDTPPDTWVRDVRPTLPDTSGGLCPQPDGPLNPVISYRFTDRAEADGAIDLDGDPASCAPVGACRDGVHNALGAMAWALNPIVQGLTGAVPFLFAFQHLGSGPGPAPYTLALWPGIGLGDTGLCSLDEVCRVLLYAEDDDEPCEPAWTFPGAYAFDGELVAGQLGTKYVIGMEAAQVGGSDTWFTIHGLQVRATLHIEGDEVVGMSGLIGGALLVDDIARLVDQARTQGLIAATQIWFLQELVEQMLNNFLPADIDTTGDGNPDAFSFALEFEAGRGTVQEVLGDELDDIWLSQF